jgi:signal transduction histidine kinase
VTSGGITIVNPSILVDRPRLSPLQLAAMVDDAAVDLERTSELGPRTRRLQFDYSMLNLTSPQRIRFRHMLEGFDSTWVDAGTQRRAVYSGLPPGRYRFVVSADAQEIGGAAAPAAWAFSVNPVFYQTWWFLGLSIAVMSAIAWVVWRSHLHRMRTQFALVLGERVRMSREIHDTLLQSMAGVALECQALANESEERPISKERFVAMRRQIEDNLREARQAIWDLRFQKLQPRDLAAALREAGEQASAGQTAHVEFQVSGDASRYGSHVEQQIVRIAREAISNAIRHANAKHVRVDLEYENDALRMRVSDDGQGFRVDPVGAQVAGHYGLASMMERARDVGGTLEVTSVDEQGTTVEAVIPATWRSGRPS